MQQIGDLQATKDKMLNHMEKQQWAQVVTVIDELLKDIERSKGLHILKINILTKQGKIKEGIRYCEKLL